MIVIRLLGGAKKALAGKTSLHFEKQSATVSEILEYLLSISSYPDLLNLANLIIAVNGTDSAALQGRSTAVNSGDVVTVVTVVHGGSPATVERDSMAVIGVKKVRSSDIGGMLDSLRKAHDGVFIQAVRADSIFGKEHALRILAIVVEARKRGVMIANRPETELLLRLACTNQISEAIERVGLEDGLPACFIAFTDDAAELKKFMEYVSRHFQLDESVLRPNARKERLLKNRLGLVPTTGSEELLNHLVENAAIITK
jgi:tRNA threonylcarbamoyladenosine modification (KEOPS) complex Cgi121 subunit/molybdopterin converting factor small subunit